MPLLWKYYGNVSNSRIKKYEPEIDKPKIKVGWYCDNCCTKVPPNIKYCPYCWSVKKTSKEGFIKKFAMEHFIPET